MINNNNIYSVFNNNKIKKNSKQTVSDILDTSNNNIIHRKFDIVTPDISNINDDNWTTIHNTKQKKDKNITNNYKNRSVTCLESESYQKYNSNSNSNINPDKNTNSNVNPEQNTNFNAVPNTKISYTQIINKSQILSQEPIQQIVQKKSFNAQPIRRVGSIQLPIYYGIKNDNDEYEIKMSEYEWVKGIGALEKSDTIDHMIKGAMTRAISYYENKKFMSTNKFFSDKRTIDPHKQEELIELICMQTIGILFHRLIKSDSVESIKTFLKFLPLYRAVPGNPVDMTKNNHSDGANAYMRVRQRFMNDYRISQKKPSNELLEADIENAAKRVAATEKKWLDFILQSVWNGNNPIHDCLYYGAKSSFEFLLFYYFQIGMYKQLNNMMLVPNIQNETHSDIVSNGKKSCESQSTFIIRRKQYEECEKLYNRTVSTLKQHSNSDFLESNITKPITNLNNNLEIESNQNTDSDGDNANICSLILNGDIDGMIKHIQRCAAANKFNIITKTFELWQAATDSDNTGQLIDYLEDTKYQTADLIPKNEILNI